MAKLFSLGVYRVFRSKERSVMTAEDFEQNQDDAILFSWTTVFIHSGLPKEKASHLAREQLKIWKEKRSQEDLLGTHAHT